MRHINGPLRDIENVIQEYITYVVLRQTYTRLSAVVVLGILSDGLSE